MVLIYENIFHREIYKGKIDIFYPFGSSKNISDTQFSDPTLLPPTLTKIAERDKNCKLRKTLVNLILYQNSLFYFVAIIN